MSKARKQTAGEPEPIFPRLPEGALGDPEVVDLILSGHGGLDLVYERLVEGQSGDARVLVRLLQEDWRALSADLRSSGEALLEEIRGGARGGGGRKGSRERPGKGAAITPAPSPENAAQFASTLEGASPASVLRAVGQAVRQCGVASRLLPLGPASTPVRDFFRSSIEVEDQHLASVIWVGGRVGSAS